MTNYLKEAQEIQAELVENRRTIHGFAELGLDLPKTSEFVIKKLMEYGYKPERCGKSGVTAVCGKGGKVLLLRADMDALPMQEATGLPFACTSGSCHSCGHDLHTAMLLGAAKLLKKHEAELNGRIKFMFQPGEEILGGAAEMIEAGVLENPHVDYGFGLHVSVGHPTMSVLGRISYKKEYSTLSGDYVRVTVNGKQAHGSSPDRGVDAINIAAHIITGLEELVSREIFREDQSVVLVGKIAGGDSCNTEAGTCVLDVSVRAETQEKRDFLKKRVKEISEGMALTFRGTAKVEYVYGMPPMYNNPQVADKISGYASELFGAENVQEIHGYSGTEDFTAIAEKIPSAYMHIGAGNLAGEGITLHNPSALFDENTLPRGAALHAYIATRFLQENC